MPDPIDWQARAVWAEVALEAFANKVREMLFGRLDDPDALPDLATSALIAELQALLEDETLHVEVIGDLMAETTTLKAEIEKLREANRWRPIAEAPPQHRVELWWPYWTNHVVTGFIRHDGLWVSDCQISDDNGLPGPTHWRPMPDPPEGA